MNKCYINRASAVITLMFVVLGLGITRCAAPEPVRPSVVFTNTVSDAD